MSIGIRGIVASGMALGITAGNPAFAGPPYVTDDPEIPPRQAWEINLAYELLQSSSPRTAEAPLLDINYGLNDAAQLSLEVPVERIGDQNGSKEVGPGDLVLGVKWRFLDETGRRPQLAFYPQVGVPTGSERRGLGAGSPSYVLPLIAEKSWGKWTAFTNVGWVRQSASATRDYMYYGAALTRELSHTMRIGAEVIGNGPTIPGASSDLGWNLGLEWQLGDCYTLLASGGHSVQGGAGTTLYLALQFHLGKWPEG